VRSNCRDGELYRLPAGARARARTGARDLRLVA